MTRPRSDGDAPDPPLALARRVLEAVEPLVFALDRDGRLTHLSGRWFALERLDPTTMLGRTARELVGAEAAAPLESAQARALAGERVSLEWWLPAADGRRHFEVSYAPLRAADGAVDGVAGVMRETTAERQSRADLLMAERMAPVGTLAGGVAHQINNPLATVMANLDFTMRELESLHDEEGVGVALAARLEELAEPLRDARDSAERIRRLVRDLQRLASTSPERRGPVDVNHALDGVIDLVWPELRFRARLVKDYGELPPVRASEGRLRELLLNLVQNAVLALPEGDPEHNELRLATARDAAGNVVVALSDSGCGIPAENLGRIFDPFFTTRPVGTSTGLGLTVCRRIVSDLGGRMSVESEVGRGTTFRVALPSVAAETAAAAGPILAPPARRGRVLVVDDEPALGKAVRRSLMADHDVTVVASGAEALARLQAGERFDAVVCDLIMPRMTGMELHAVLERDAPEVAARMIFLTGGAAMPEAREFLDRVPNPRVDKPFEAKNLAAIVARVVK